MAIREHRLRVGYDKPGPGETFDHAADVRARWEESVTREGWTVVTPPGPLTLVHSAGLTEMGQFALEVTGEVDDGQE